MINWMSSLQDVTTLSVTMTGYIAVVKSFKQKKWLKDLISELCPILSFICVYSDNQSAIHLDKNKNMFHQRTKHIDIKYNFICDETELKRITLV